MPTDATGTIAPRCTPPIPPAATAGLVIDFLREHEILVWQAFPDMVETGVDQFELAPGTPRIPLSFSIGATKPA